MTGNPIHMHCTRSDAHTHTHTHSLTHTHPAYNAENVSKLLKVLGVGEDSPVNMLANTNMLAAKPETAVAMCTLGPTADKVLTLTLN